MSLLPQENWEPPLRTPRSGGERGWAWGRGFSVCMCVLGDIVGLAGVHMLSPQAWGVEPVPAWAGRRAMPVGQCTGRTGCQHWGCPCPPAAEGWVLSWHGALRPPGTQGEERGAGRGDGVPFWHRRGEKGPVGIVARLPSPWQGWEPAFLPPAQCTGECRTLVFFIINNNC